MSDIDLSSASNRQAVANVIGYYANKEVGISYYAKGMVPIGNSPRGTVGLRDYGSDDALAFQVTGGNIWVNKHGNSIDTKLSNKYNLINTLVHENEHKRLRHGELDNSTRRDIAEIATYSTQIKHSSFLKTTKDYQKLAISELVDNINISINKGAAPRKIERTVNEINESMNNKGYFQLQYVENYQSISVNIKANKK